MNIDDMSLFNIQALIDNLKDEGIRWERISGANKNCTKGTSSNSKRRKERSDKSVSHEPYRKRAKLADHTNASTLEDSSDDNSDSYSSDSRDSTSSSDSDSDFERSDSETN